MASQAPKEGSGGPWGVPLLRQEGPKSANVELVLKPVALALEQEGNQDVGRKQSDGLSWDSLSLLNEISHSSAD